MLQSSLMAERVLDRSVLLPSTREFGPDAGHLVALVVGNTTARPMSTPFQKYFCTDSWLASTPPGRHISHLLRSATMWKAVASAPYPPFALRGSRRRVSAARGKG